MATNPVEKFGLKWAAKISKAYEDWAAQEQKTRTIKIKPFDPEPQIKLAFYDAGEGQLEEIGKLVGMGVKFDLRSPEAEAWIQKYATDQIKYLNSTQLQNIRQIKLRAFQEGLTIQEQRALIKENIGLLPQHVVAVQNYYEQLMIAGTDDGLAADMRAKYADRLLNYRANMIGRTESMMACNNGRRISNENAVSRGVIDPGEYEQEWVVSGLPNMCDECQDMNGETAEIGDTFSTPEGDLDGPPLHPHCLLPGTRCIAPGGGIAMIRHLFTGNSIELTISGGAQISVTPDHLFLTPLGFAAANLLRKGDQIIYCPNPQRTSSTGPDDNQCVPTIDNVFNALSISLGMSTGTMPIPSEDLNSNGGIDNDNVNIIRSDGFLEDAFQTAIDKAVTKKYLVGHCRSKPSLSCDSEFAFMLKGIGDSTFGNMSGLRASSPFFRARLRHGKNGCLFDPTDNNPLLSQHSVNHTPIMSDFFGYAFNGHPGLIEFQDIIDIKIKPFHGYVYDIESISTFLICNGILTSNCTCGTILVKK
jgi:hypothetical protein